MSKAPGLVVWALLVAGCMGERRAEFWVDLALGEPITQEELLEDLVEADVVYLGETHRLERHHRLQREILEGLLASGRPVVLGLEQVESRYQSDLDRFNDGEISFQELAEAIEWEKQWTNYLDYRAMVERAKAGGARVVGLNGPHGIIRQVGRGGIASLEAGDRAQLPGEVFLEDPVYEQLMNKILQVHATMDPEFLRNVFEAQAARDDSMAAALVEALRSAGGGDGGKSLGVVICGAGHVQFGLGTPDRVRRRLPEASQRIVLMSESGDLELTEAEEAMRREIEIAHGDLEFIERPLADYLHVKAQAPEKE